MSFSSKKFLEVVSADGRLKLKKSEEKRHSKSLAGKIAPRALLGHQRRFALGHLDDGDLG